MIKIRELEKVESHLDELDQRMALAIKKKNKLITQVNKEEKDWRKLESLSMKGLFYKVLGSKKEQVEKERQEYLQAFLKLEEHNKEIEAIEFEENILAEKKTKHAGLRQILKKLMKQREAELKRSGAPAGRRIKAIEKELDHAKVVLWEIGQAEQEGQKAIRILDEMIHYLKSARGWGQWGGQRSRSWEHYTRRTNIDRARERGHHAKQQLLRFQSELKDLYPNPKNYARELQMDFYQGFLENLFNNLLSDWVLQQKVTNALNLVKSIRDQVALELGHLGSEREQQKNQEKDLRKEKKNILLSK
ncbi:MAG: hypothetical protein HKN16_05455 [Saprospiraceae bacterium]|nr:hypothetical protein [Saprospiraceae bacterium]